MYKHSKHYTFWSRIRSFLLATIITALYLVHGPISSYSQYAADRVAGQERTETETLEQKLAIQRQSGKQLEDPSLQNVEDDIMQAKLDEVLARQPQGQNKGPKLHLKMPVLYATNRLRVESALSAQPTPDNSVEFGIANVTIETDKGVRTDYLPRASFTKADGDPEVTRLANAGKFVSLMMSEALMVQHSPKVLIFVHGFNTSFDEALERTALIATELQTPVIPIMYSWPSAGSVRKYFHDEEVVRASTEAFDSFLKQVITKSPGKVVLISHSMGAREVTSTLSDLAKEKFDTGKLSSVVFVAADIFTSEFQSRWSALQGLKATRYAFYASDNDLALKWSFWKHDAPRLGCVDLNLWPPPGAITIDASNIDSIFNTFGHSYIENPQFGADIGNWVTSGRDPTHRGLLSRQTPNGPVYYFP